MPEAPPTAKLSLVHQERPHLVPVSPHPDESVCLLRYETPRLQWGGLHAAGAAVMRMAQSRSALRLRRECLLRGGRDEDVTIDLPA